MMTNLDYIDRIKRTINELLIFQDRTKAPAPQPHQFIGTAIDNTVCLLTAPLNSLIKPPDPCTYITFDKPENWLSVIKAIHRSFFSDILTATERGLVDLCQKQNIQPDIKRNDQLDKIIENLSSKADKALISSEIKKLKSFKQPKPLFADNLDSLLEAEGYSKTFRAKWRNYFRGLTIVRNKASHEDTSLTQQEKEHLNKYGFQYMVSSQGELELNSRMYNQVIVEILSFFDKACRVD